MQKIIIIIVILFSGFFIQAQNLTDIANSLLGKRVYEINPTLDSLGIWHYTHYPFEPTDKKLKITIEEESGISFFMKLFFNKKPDHEMQQEVIKITINFVHGAQVGRTDQSWPFLIDQLNVLAINHSAWSL